MALRNLLRNRDDDTPQGNPYDPRSEDPYERSLARDWEQQQNNPLPIWDPNYVSGVNYDPRSEDPTERAAARDVSQEQNIAFAQNYGLQGYTPGFTNLLPADKGISQSRGWDDLINRWTSNKDATLPTMNMTPEQKQQFLQQVYANPNADATQFLTPEQRQVAQTMFTFYDQNSGFDGFQKALMAGMIGGFGGLVAGPYSTMGAEAAGGAGAGVNAGGLDGVLGDAMVNGITPGTYGAGVGEAAAAGAGAMTQAPAPVVEMGRQAGLGDMLRVGLTEGGLLKAAGSALGPLSNFLPDGSSTSGLLSTLGQTLLGGYAANQQSGAYSDLANQFLGMGQPYRDRLNATYDPNWSFANTPDMQRSSQAAMDQAARALSTKFGNPAESPSAIGELLKYGIDNNLNKSFDYRNQLGQFGGLGAAPVAAGANSGMLGVKAQGGLYESLGSGFENLMNPYKLNTGNYL